MGERKAGRDVTRWEWPPRGGGGRGVGVICAGGVFGGGFRDVVTAGGTGGGN